MIGRVAKIYLGAVLVFLYLPIVVMIAMAFNRSALYEMPFTFDLVWFKALAQNERLLQASWNSVWIACINTVIATTLGTLVAYAFARYEFRAKRLLQILLFPPITIPWLIIGTSMLIFFFWTGIGRGLHAILLGHVALSLPYVIVVVGARFANFGPELEEAAASLGNPLNRRQLNQAPEAQPMPADPIALEGIEGRKYQTAVELWTTGGELFS